MRNTALLVVLSALLMTGAGCKNVTNVQKGIAAGSAVGAGVGAAVGSYVTSAGIATGALVGAGAGGVGGAIAAEQLYGEDEESIKKAMALEEQLQSEKARARGLAKQVDELEADKQALLAELERMRDELNNRPEGDTAPKASVDRESMALVVPFKSDVLFAPGKATLSSEGKRELHKAVLTIRKKFKDAEIEVHGHTDSTPIRYSDFRSNWHLSTARACEVVQYLINSEGFRKDRLVSVGFADTDPVASNDTAAGRAKNRRAELVVRPSQGK